MMVAVFLESRKERDFWNMQSSPQSSAKPRRFSMAQNHYVTKTKRRQKSGKRKDPSAATMAKLRQLAAADTKKSVK
jgi:hypothetical protein